jgi:DnaB-like helicase N terminal domain
MDEALRHPPIVEIERQLLAALCSPALDHSIRADILAGLRAYTFANPDHDVIFRALAKMPRAAIAHIRETLSARLTRMGFPDIDVHPIFELEPPSAEKINVLLQQLGR